MVNQVEYHSYPSQIPLIEYCREHYIQFEAWSPLGMGNLINDPNLQELAASKNKSDPQIILR